MIMKRLIVCMFLTVLGVSTVSAQPENMNQKDANGLKIGLWQEQVPEGNASGFYTDGLKESTWVTRNANSNALLKVESFIKGKHNGIVLDFNQQGQMVGEKYYIDDLLEGTAKTYFWGTQVASSINYKHGKLDGKKQVFYENSNGKLQEESFYKDGVKDGTSKWYSNNGDPIAEYVYVNGNLTGVQKMYFPGKKLQSEQNYVNNLESGPYKEYFESGKLKIESNFANGKQEGKYTEYDENGSKVREGNFASGLEEGKWLYFDKAGKVMKTKKFIKGAEQK
jgi:antitoxin component YwqK of YwqJK toxin-antitoxin module